MSKSVFDRYRGRVERTIETTLKTIPARDLSSARSELDEAERRVSAVVTELFHDHKIAAEAICRLDEPVITWPKEGSAEPQIIVAKEFFEEVERDAHLFFKKQREQRQQRAKEMAELDEHDRQEERKTDKLQHEHEQAQRLEKDQHDKWMAEQDAIKTKVDLEAKKDDKKLRMDLEQELRLHKLAARKVDEDYSRSEVALLKLEMDRRRAEEEVKQIGEVVSTELEAARAAALAKTKLAERAFETDTYERLSRMLPSVLEKIGQSTPNIGELRILQMGGNDDSATDPTKSAGFQLAQAITLIRELASAVEPPKRS